MTPFISKNFALLSAFALCLSISACSGKGGGSPELVSSDDVVNREVNRPLSGGASHAEAAPADVAPKDTAPQGGGSTPEPESEEELREFKPLPQWFAVNGVGYYSRISAQDSVEEGVTYCGSLMPPRTSKGEVYSKRMVQSESEVTAFTDAVMKNASEMRDILDRLRAKYKISHSENDGGGFLGSVFLSELQISEARKPEYFNAESDKILESKLKKSIELLHLSDLLENRAFKFQMIDEYGSQHSFERRAVGVESPVYAICIAVKPAPQDILDALFNMFTSSPESKK